MEYTLIAAINIAIFIVLSMMLYVVIIPSKKEFSDYRKSRRILGFAFMMIAVLGIIRLIFKPEADKQYMDVCVIILFSLVYNTLIFLSFLYLIETSRPKRKVVKKTTLWCAIICLILIICGTIFKEMRSLFKICISTIYLASTIYIFTCCIREYDKFTFQMNNIFDVLPDMKWMPGMLWTVFVLCFITTGSFMYRPIFIITGVASSIIYSYLSMKILSFAPANINMARKSIETSDDSAQTTVDTLAEETKTEPGKNTEPVAQKVETPAIKGYAKIAHLVDKWVDEEKFTRPETSIKEAASEMGTNANYLSGYINRELNTTFAVWLNTLRVEKSKEYLLSDERFSIEECGSKVGYTSVYNYSRWFKQITGDNPSSFRKYHKASNMSR